MSQLAATRRGRSLRAKISGGRGRPRANILIPLERQLIALQFAADSLYIINFAADFLSCIVEVVQKTTDLGILIPILRKLGAA